MKSPIEQLRNRSIKALPIPSQLAYSANLSLTQPQRESLLDIFPYLHGSSHGYGQQGPIRRRLQEKGLIKAKDDGWIPTKLGYQVVALLLHERESELAIDAEIRKILSLLPRVIAHRDWDQLMHAVRASSRLGSAIQLVKNLLPGIEYVVDESHPLGARFVLPKEMNLSDLFHILSEKSRSGLRLGYAS
jgi:hypothetical protein